MAKKLLSEAVVRRFAKLANLNINENVYAEEEEAPDAEMPPEEEAPDLDAEMPEEEPMDDMAGGEDLELTDEEAQAIIDLGKKLEAAMPEGGGEEDLGDDLGGEELAGDDLGGDLGGEEEEAPVLQEKADELEEDITEALSGINYIPGKQEIVEEVARRVAKRLLKAKRANVQMKEALGSRRKSKK